jgi:hypothetical protein
MLVLLGAGQFPLSIQKVGLKIKAVKKPLDFSKGFFTGQ